MPDPFKANMAAMRAMSHGKNYKNREGGIDPEAWKGISKDEKKEMAEAGLMQSGHQGFMMHAGNIMNMKKADKSREKWEKGGYEMGYGNIKTADQLREVFQKGKDLGINDMDSFNDVRQFRPEATVVNNYTTKEEPKKEKEPTEETTVTDSQRLARAKAYKDQKDESDMAGDTTQSKVGTNPVSGAQSFNRPDGQGIAADFLDKYSGKVKENLEPKKVNVSASIADAAKSEFVGS